ncbi:MAG: hypothetical protein JWQ95_2190 [Sphaerisporangium sp.]|nr:hypothetical protein [Sphaerisporangium sp.]
MSLSVRIRVQPSKLRELSARALVVRFLFGAITSVIAALIGERWGPVAGGIFLAFPATLAATLTLIQDEARSRIPVVEDARGAVLGATGMIAFAVCVWLLATRIPTLLALGVATVVWAVVAGALYVSIWGFRGE